MLDRPTGFSVLSEGLRDVRRFVGARPATSFVILLGTSILSLGHLAEVIAPFSPFVSSPYFPYFHETHDVLAIFLTLYAAYRWLPALALMGISLFLVLHVPYFLLDFQPPEALRIAYSSLGSIFGVWLIAERRRARDLLQRRYDELLAVNRITQRLLEERAHISAELEEVKGHLGRLLSAGPSLAGRLPPAELCRGILGLVLEVTGLEGGEIWLLDQGRRELHLVCQRGEFLGVLQEGSRLGIGEGLPGLAVLQQVPVFRDGGAGPSRRSPGIEGTSGLVTICAIPLSCRQKVIGALTVAGRDHRELSAAETDKLVALAESIAPLLEPLAGAGT